MYTRLLVLLVGLAQIASGLQRYTPDWNSLDTRPLPQWYDDAKIGIFIHWGVFSVPSFRSEWFWYDWKNDKPSQDIVDFMNKNYPPGFTYADFANQFRAEFFDPNQWADIFQASGAKYVVLTSKHHEGYCMWPSANSWNWNSMTVGPNRNLVGDLAVAVRNRTNLRFGLYHSLYEWYNPLYLDDKSSGFKTQNFVDLKTMPELYDIVNNYKPEVIWSDGDWETTDAYWKSTEFLAWLYNDSPVKDTVVTNDRWGAGDMCRHGDFYTCSDNYNPGKLLDHKWENCMPLDRSSWGFRRNMNFEDVLSTDQVISSLTETISCGGNILINIGPTKEGHIAPIFEERLRTLGQWLGINGEAIYSSKPWKYQNDTLNSDVWYTQRSNNVYAIVLHYNTTKIEIQAPKSTESTTVNVLGYNGTVQWIPSPGTNGIIIDLSQVDSTKLPNKKWSSLVLRLQNIL